MSRQPELSLTMKLCTLCQLKIPPSEIVVAGGEGAGRRSRYVEQHVKQNAYLLLLRSYNSNHVARLQLEEACSLCLVRHRSCLSKAVYQVLEQLVPRVEDVQHISVYLV